jgi:OOP family OmpA-OmpF porin
MKNNFTITLILFSLFATNAQTQNSKKDTTSTYNRWTIEASVGQAKGVRPYEENYFSSNPKSYFGSLQANSFSFSTRYMINSIFGVKASLHFEELQNTKNNGSLPFKMNMYGLSVQGVINANRLLNIEEEMGRFNFLFHGGLKFDQMTSKTENTITENHNYGKKDINIGLVVGISPQIRLSNKLSLLLDLSIQNNFRQHFNWDGSSSKKDNNLNGQLISSSIGLTYSIGKNKIHGDWTTIITKQSVEIEKLDERIGRIEILMDDSDKDGVADYLDQENNSVAGVAVDSRGKMVDLNRNGVPDEMEKYVANSIKKTDTKSNEKAINSLINDGYVTTYFETNKSKPTDISTQGIDFIRTFLINNPEVSIDIIGHADEMGQTDKNIKLSKDRAEAIKSILIQSGISASRLNIVAQGEDTSVNKESDGAKKLVRRVTFRIKE